LIRPNLSSQNRNTFNEFKTHSFKEESMAKLPLSAPAGVPQHIIQRGNNRQVSFARSQDMQMSTAFLCKALEKYVVQCHGWVLMTNHVHLLSTPSMHRFQR
jgi:REP element-mobilizing transposase RayT